MIQTPFLLDVLCVERVLSNLYLIALIYFSVTFSLLLQFLRQVYPLTLMVGIPSI